MLLITHILVSVLSLVGSLASFVLLKKQLISASWMLIAASIVSGIGLVVLTDASIVRVCSEGLLISSFSATFAYLAQRKLANQKS